MTRATFHGRRGNVGAAVGVLLVYVAVLCLMPKHVFWSPDEGGKFLELHSLHWDGGLTYRVPYAGQRLDPHFEFYPGVSTVEGDTFPYPAVSTTGGVRFHWPIWFPLLSGFMLRAFGLTGIYIIPLLSGWLIALISGRIVHSFTPRLAPLTMLLVGFATPVCFYSQCFWEHTLAAVLGLLAVAILVAAPRRSPATLVAMLPALLLAMMLRIEMVAFAAAALLAWGLSGLVTSGAPAFAGDGVPASPTRPFPGQRPGWGSYLLLAGVAAGVLALVATTAPVRQRHLITALPAQLGATLRKVPRVPRSLVSLFVNTGRENGPLVDPAWVALAGIAVALCFVAPFVTSVRIEAAIIVSALILMLAFSMSLVFLDQRYRALHGIFPVAPFLIIWLYALPDAWRRRDRALLTLGGLAALYLIIGCAAIFVFHVDAEGGLLSGLEWGQRYLLTLYPILTVLSVVALSTYWKSPRPVRLKMSVTVLVAVLMLIGVEYQVRGLVMLRANRIQFSKWDDALRTDGPIVTDLWWLPTTLAPLFLAKEMSYVRGPSELADWVPLAVAQGISEFTFVGLAPVHDQQLGTAAARGRPQDGRFVLGLYLTRFDVLANGNPPTPP